jgi:hypothetical protein
VAETPVFHAAWQACQYATANSRVIRAGGSPGDMPQCATFAQKTAEVPESVKMGFGESNFVIPCKTQDAATPVDPNNRNPANP